MSNKPKRQIIISIVLMITLLFLGIAPIVTVVGKVFQKTEWSIEEINRGLQIPIPDTASDIVFEGHTDRGGFLRLTFNAPSNDAQTFARQFCEGILHSGYDPFTAVDFAEPFTYAVPIRIGYYSYFSYSPNVNNRVYGNRCFFAASGGQLQLRLDLTQSNVGQVTLEKRFTCEDACKFIPLNITKPLPNTPIEILGVKEEKGKYSLINREICVGLGLKTALEREKWQEIIGGELEVLIDHRPMFNADILPNGAILDRTASASQERTGERLEDYFYCFQADSQIGLRQVNMTIYTPGGKSIPYTVEFQVV